ncbi:MAG TPA: hypothetical protein VF786_02005 [Terriglobales bacterium]
MRHYILSVLISLFSIVAVAQMAAPAEPATQPAQTGSNLDPILNQAQTVAQNTSADLAKLRISKWKADGNSKQQAQSNTDSLTRNLNAALPELVNKARNAPLSLGPTFTLYRNVNALYDVLANVAESAGAFGPRDQYDPLANDVAQWDQIRHNLADHIEQLASNTDAELTRLRTQAAMAARAQQAPPKKVVVDDNAPAPATKTTPKKKKPAASSSSSQAKPQE